MTARSIRRAMERKAKKLEKKRLLANQANALDEAAILSEPKTQKMPSTGPRSEEGRAKSSINAVKTGLTGRTVLLPSDDTAEYDRHVAAFYDEYQPVGVQECELVQSIADTFWRLRRIPIIETAIFAKGRIEFAELFSEQDLAARPRLIDAHTFITYEKQIRNLQLQEARLARRREKEIAELRRLQNERLSKTVTGEHSAPFAESDACHQNSAPGAEEEFAITFHAEQRAFYDVRRKSLSLKRFSHPAAGLLMQRWIAYDAAPANVLAAHFELRFYQHDPVGFTLCNRNQRGNEKANGYKTDVADNDVHRFADIFHRHIPRIGLFM